MTDPTRIAEANRIYWETDVSVADIAERFDLSRRALYHVVTPLQAGIACATCGQGLHYENRSARRDGLATCPECGARSTVRDLAGPAPDAMLEPLPAVRDLRTDGRATADGGDARKADLRSRAMLLGGAAIAGVAIGTVAAMLARRRD